jgi:predicted RNase H-like HicB family nuclease
MTFHVLLRERPEGHFTATVLSLPACIGEGPTRQAALDAARTAIVELLQGEIVQINVPLHEHGPAKAPQAGRFKNDPTYDDFLAHISWSLATHVISDKCQA